MSAAAWTHVRGACPRLHECALEMYQYYMQGLCLFVWTGERCAKNRKAPSVGAFLWTMYSDEYKKNSICIRRAKVRCVSKKSRARDREGTRTPNLMLRRHTPYPLGHATSMQIAKMQRNETKIVFDHEIFISVLNKSVNTQLVMSDIPMDKVSMDIPLGW
jgi:hypothetical protein